MKPGLLIHEWRRTFACWSLAMATAFAYVLWEHSPLRTTTIPLALVGALVGIVTAWALFTEPRACAVFTFSGGLSRGDLFRLRMNAGRLLIAGWLLLTALVLGSGLRQWVQTNLFLNQWFPMVRWFEFRGLWPLALHSVLGFHLAAALHIAGGRAPTKLPAVHNLPALLIVHAGLAGAVSLTGDGLRSLWVLASACWLTATCSACTVWASRAFSQLRVLPGVDRLGKIGGSRVLALGVGVLCAAPLILPFAVHTWSPTFGPAVVPRQIGLLAVLLAMLFLTITQPRKHRFPIGLAVVGVATALLLFIGGHREPGDWQHVGLSLTTSPPVTGVEVSCNGVDLGATPLTISRDEFVTRVSPLTEPPDLECLLRENGPSTDYRFALLSTIPLSPFAAHETWPPRTMGFPATQEEAVERLEAARWWWTFRHDGCVALARPELGGNSGSSHGRGNRLWIQTSVQLRFPGSDRHVECLRAHLTANGGIPTAAWLDHVAGHLQLLFQPLHQATRDDPDLQQALRQAVLQLNDLPASPTPDQADRALLKVLSRVEELGCFVVPSPESLIMETVAESHPQILQRHVRELLWYRSTSRSRSSGEDWYSEARGGKALGLVPLLYGVRHNPPSGLYNVLVYRAGLDASLLPVLGAYGRPETAAIVNRMLNDSLTDHARGGRELLRVVDPRAEPALRQWVRDTRPKPYQVRTFIELRIGHPEIDQAELAGWVFHWAPLDEQAKRDLLVGISSTATSHYLRLLTAQAGDQILEGLVWRLTGEPNPSLDSFLVNLWQRQKQQEHRSGLMGMVMQAMLAVATPRIHAALEEEWQGHDERTRQTLLTALAAVPTPIPALPWLLREEHLPQTPADLGRVCRILGRMDSPQAGTLLRELAETSPSDRVRRTARTELAARDDWERERAELLELADALVSGILSVPSFYAEQLSGHRYAWDGTGYVPVE